MDDEKKVNEKLEAVSNEILEYCIKKGLTISEMNNLTMVFPRTIRKAIRAFEKATAFTLDSVQDDPK